MGGGGIRSSRCLNAAPGADCRRNPKLEWNFTMHSREINSIKSGQRPEGQWAVKPHVSATITISSETSQTSNRRQR